jgi:hypothetical protein
MEGELLEMWITFDSEMPNLPLPLDSLTQSNKKSQAILFCHLKHSFTVCISGFSIVYLWVLSNNQCEE